VGPFGSAILQVIRTGHTTAVTNSVKNVGFRPLSDQPSSAPERSDMFLFDTSFEAEIVECGTSIDPENLEKAVNKEKGGMAIGDILHFLVYFEDYQALKGCSEVEASLLRRMLVDGGGARGDGRGFKAVFEYMSKLDKADPIVFHAAGTLTQWIRTEPKWLEKKASDWVPNSKSGLAQVIAVMSRLLPRKEAVRLRIEGYEMEPERFLTRSLKAATQMEDALLTLCGEAIDHFAEEGGTSMQRVLIREALGLLLVYANEGRPYSKPCATACFRLINKESFEQSLKSSSQSPLFWEVCSQLSELEEVADHHVVEALHDIKDDILANKGLKHVIDTWARLDAHEDEHAGTALQLLNIVLSWRNEALFVVVRVC
jgi:hypothetical protein